jgi:uncharacterized membrane protein YvlD (DUF360 family)
MYSFKDLFTPLDKKYCNYFYYLSVITYFVFIFIVLAFVLMLVFHFKKLDLNISLNFISAIISTFFAYFVNRLMYSMCVKSLL